MGRATVISRTARNACEGCPFNGLCVMLVGHSDGQARLLEQLIREQARGAETVCVNATREFEREVNETDVLIVNHHLDGYFLTTNGNEFIRHYRQQMRANCQVAMLFSDFDDVQAEAIAAGASPGFGRSGVFDDAAGANLRAALIAARETRRARAA